jgi:hypothetical protein
MTENGTEIGRSADVAAEGSIAAEPSPDIAGYGSIVTLHVARCMLEQVQQFVNWLAAWRKDQLILCCFSCRGGEHVTFKIVAIIAVLSAGVVLVASLIGTVCLALASFSQQS